ncbi:uncharacterized protein LOC115242776 [Formica exsecta]|uniref:uncharacterized protein LOC115242776 n=1 Tax=Formica exsecta TaxID=72781 RepID=UPI001142397A|nr:uncharacterized protein LOC115242776 [Formica exsecta]
MQQPDTRHHHRDENVGYGAHYSQEITQKKNTEKRKEEDRLDRVEAELKRMNGLLQKILKCIQDRHFVSQKPAELPISSIQQMDAFENIDDNDYSDVVKYFQYIGGFHLKEAVNLIN